MAQLRLFGPARQTAGTSRATVPGHDVATVLSGAESRFGDGFSRVLAVSNIWLNGECASPDTPVDEDDEVAVLPPVSGG